MYVCMYICISLSLSLSFAGNDPEQISREPTVAVPLLRGRYVLVVLINSDLASLRIMKALAGPPSGEVHRGYAGS